MGTLRDNKAFSLIEMITVVVITIPITIGATVIFSETIARKNLEAEAARMISDLNWARQMALAKSQNYAGSFDVSTDTMYIYESSISPSNLRRTLRFGVDLESAPSVLWFYYPKGDASLDTTISLRKGTRSVSAQVFAKTGFVRLN